MQGVTPDNRVIAATKRQPEYGKPVGAYINDMVSQSRITRGISKGKRNGQRPSTRSRKNSRSSAGFYWRSGAWKPITARPRINGTCSARCLSLAFVKYRDPYFRNELIVAMSIMQNGHFGRDQMVSSWAGAMGQTQ